MKPLLVALFPLLVFTGAAVTGGALFYNKQHDIVFGSAFLLFVIAGMICGACVVTLMSRVV